MQKSFLRETAGAIMRSIVVVSTIVLIFVSISALYEVESGISDGSCNIAVYPLQGVILPYVGIGEFDIITTPESVENFMTAVEEEDSIKGVLVEINSPGGTPVASERIAERFRNGKKTTVGLIGDTGASGGYMIAAATHYLVASPMSDVGSIGVNMSFVEESEKNEEEGLTYVQLTTGKYKDIGSPNRPITDEEKKLLQEDLDIVHNYFIDLVSKYRNLDREKVEKLADGSSMPGIKALDSNLVDALGGRQVAREKFAEILKLDVSDVTFCEYETSLLPFY